MKLLALVFALALTGCVSYADQQREINLRAAMEGYGMAPPPRAPYIIPLIPQTPQMAPYMMPINPVKPFVTPEPYGNAYVTGYMRSQSVNGSLRYCNYSNGMVRTIASHELCPLDTN